METERRIEEILNSANGMTRVIPNDLLFSKIMSKVNVEKKLPTPYIWIAAASFAILLSLNIKMICSKEVNTNNTTESVAATIAKTNQLY